MLIKSNGERRYDIGDIIQDRYNGNIYILSIRKAKGEEEKRKYGEEGYIYGIRIVVGGEEEEGWIYEEGDIDIVREIIKDKVEREEYRVYDGDRYEFSIIPKSKRGI